MNTIQLIGRLTADPELRYTNGGKPVRFTRLAFTRAEEAPCPPRRRTSRRVTA